MHDPSMALIRAVMELAAGKADFHEHLAMPWASKNFSGLRHEMTLHFHGPKECAAGDALSQCLSTHEFAIPGHIVTEIRIASRIYQGGTAPILILEIHAATVAED